MSKARPACPFSPKYYYLYPVDHIDVENVDPKMRKKASSSSGLNYPGIFSCLHY